jgi:hypothetical protein
MIVLREGAGEYRRVTLSKGSQLNLLSVLEKKKEREVRRKRMETDNFERFECDF